LFVASYNTTPGVMCQVSYSASELMRRPPPAVGCGASPDDAATALYGAFPNLKRTHLYATLPFRAGVCRLYRCGSIVRAERPHEMRNSMATQFTLDVQPREVLGKKVKHLRTQGLIPATVYGKGMEPVSVQVNGRAFMAVYRKAGKTGLIELHLGAARKAAFVQAVQRHPLTRDIIHIDFKVVDLRKAIHVEVPVLTVGESPLVARGDALINHALNTVMVEALPADVPQHIDVDVSGLDTLDKTIHVRDIPPARTYKILTSGDEVLISLTPVRAAVAEGPIEEVPVEPELIRRERAKEEEEES